jgi:hypothetical protein
VKLKTEYRIGNLVFVAQLNDKEGKMVSYIKESDWIVTDVTGTVRIHTDKAMKEQYEAIDESTEPHHNS